MCIYIIVTIDHAWLRKGGWERGGAEKMREGGGECKIFLIKTSLGQIKVS